MATIAAIAGPALEVEWYPVACRECGRRIARVQIGALRDGGKVEIRCRDCKTRNYLDGRPAGGVGLVVTGYGGVDR